MCAGLPLFRGVVVWCIVELAGDVVFVADDVTLMVVVFSSDPCSLSVVCDVTDIVDDVVDTEVF